MALSIGASVSAQLAYGAGGSTGSITTQASGSTFVVVLLADSNTTNPILTDSFGNVYAPIAQVQANSTSGAFSIWYAENATGGAGHTWTFTNTGNIGSWLSALEIKGASGHAALETYAVSPTTFPSSPVNGPSVTLTEAGDVLISIFQSTSNVAQTITSSLGGIQQSLAVSSTTEYAGAIGATVQSAAGTFHDTWSWTSNYGGIGTALLGFKLSTAAAAAVASGSPTEVKDAAFGVGGESITGTANAAEKRDTISALGNVPILPTGTASDAEGRDTVLIVGGTTISGTASPTERAEVDVAAGTVVTGIPGAGSSTEGSDVLGASGGVVSSGVAAAKEGADPLVGSGAVTSVSFIGLGASTSASLAYGLGGSTTGITTQAINSTFVAYLISDTATQPTLTDSYNNTWTLVQAVPYNGGSASMFIWSAENGVGGAGHTFTLTSTTDFAGWLAVKELKGTAGHATLEVAGYSPTTYPSGSEVGPTITTANAGDILVSLLAVTANAAQTFASSLGGIVQQVATPPTNEFAGALGVTVQAAPGAVYDTWTYTSNYGGVGSALLAYRLLANAPPSASGAPVESADVSSGQGGTSVSGAAVATEAADGSPSVGVVVEPTGTTGGGTSGFFGSSGLLGFGPIASGPIGYEAFSGDSGSGLAESSDTLQASGSVSGTVAASGSAVASESADVAQSAGTIATPPAIGAATATEQQDAAQALGGASVSGAAVLTEAPDQAAGTTNAFGTGVAAERADVTQTAGGVVDAGAGQASDAQDQLAGTGALGLPPNSGGASSTEGQDNGQAIGSVNNPPATGAGQIAESQDSTQANGGTGVSGSANSTEEPDVTAGADAALFIPGNGHVLHLVNRMTVYLESGPQIVVKSPFDTILLDVDCTQLLGVGETIANATTTSANVTLTGPAMSSMSQTYPDGVTVQGGQLLQFVISGGTIPSYAPWVDVLISTSLTTSLGEVITAAFIVRLQAIY